MARVSEDFLRFLLANYPDDYRRASVKDVKEDVINAIMSKHARHYQIWQKIPDWIKDRHGDRIPPEVLNGNESPQAYINEETVAQNKEDNELTGYSVSMLALGYSEEAVAKLMKNRDTRKELLKAAQNGKLPEDLHDLWLETRANDILAISQDWQKNQPEKYLFRLAKLLSREEGNLDRAETSTDRMKSEKEITALRKELMDFAQRLNTRQSKQNMVDYLRAKPQQAALRHLDTDVLSLFTGVMRDQGIKIEPVNAANSRSLSSHRSLSESLRQDYELIKQNETIINDITNRSNRSMARIVDDRTTKKKNNKSKAKMISLKKNKESVAMRA